MRHTQESWNRTLGFGLLGLLVVLTLPCFYETGNASASRAFAPSIKITLVPRDGEGGPDILGTIGGVASGVDFDNCKVVVFAHTNMWYVQPDTKAPYTQIQNDGRWETDTRLGHVYAALLVKSGYKPPDTTRTLPQIGGNILAIARATPTK
jgi:hypothetical protein